MRSIMEYLNHFSITPFDLICGGLCILSILYLLVRKWKETFHKEDKE